MLQGFYLPFVFTAFSMLIGGNWVADIFGILAGHLCAASPFNLWRTC